MTVSKDGVMYINPNKISYKILKWMQEHEGTQTLKKTTNHNIADKICALPDVTNGVTSIEQTLSKMIRNKVIYRDKYPRGICADFRINYWHKSIPASILAKAPVEVKRAMAKTIDDMKPGQYMDNEGCVVTPAYAEKNEDPFSEDDDDTNTEHISTISTWAKAEKVVEPLIKPVEKTVEEAIEEVKEEKVKEADAIKEVLKTPVEAPAEPAVSMQELYAQKYCNDLAEDERFKPYAEYIKSGKFLQELSKYGVTLFDKNGEINDSQIKTFLGCIVKDLDKKEAKEAPAEASPIQITKSKDGKTMSITVNITLNL